MWDAEQALAALDIRQAPFDNSHAWEWNGYARGRAVHVKDGVDNPLEVMLHEIAHVLLGHTEIGNTRPSHVQEWEAASVAMRCLKALGQRGELMTRVYVDGRRREGQIPPDSEGRVVWAAKTILEAGRVRRKAQAIAAVPVQGRKLAAMPNRGVR
jgi:hypothetical protein